MGIPPLERSIHYIIFILFLQPSPEKAHEGFTSATDFDAFSSINKEKPGAKSPVKCGSERFSVALGHEIGNVLTGFLVAHGHAHDGGEDGQGDDFHIYVLL